MARNQLSNIYKFVLSINLSNRYAYAQIFRAVDNHVVATASTLEKGLKEAVISKVNKADVESCTRVGETLAERALQAGVTGVTWPRKQGQKYHGRTAALITAMQKAGVPLI